MASDYVELHCHSCFSLLEGASTPLELVLRARALGYEALALTDHDGLYGAMEFARTARAWGLRPIVGAELTLQGGHHLTLLAETQQGYANLCRLISAALLSLEGQRPAPRRGGALVPLPPPSAQCADADTRGGTAASPPSDRPPLLTAGLPCPREWLSEGWPRPALDVLTLAQYAEGLIALTGCRRGEVPALLAAGQRRAAESTLDRLLTIFGRDHVFVELQRNLVQGEAQLLEELVGLARRRRIGYVATNNVHYHVRERHQLQDVMVAIRHRTTLDGSHRLRRENSEYYLKSPEEMAQLFAAYPEALRASVAIAARCRFDLSDTGYRFPDYPVPPGDTQDACLRRVCYQAALQKYGADGQLPPEVTDRLEEELALIQRHQLAGFFLIYRDLLLLARQVADDVRGWHASRLPADQPAGRGRGSSVGSIVCYLIGLSHIDPLRYNLFVGRFLNEELRSVPDIDLDFARDVREELILRVYQKFGPEHAALVCAFPTYRIRSAIRDVGKALGLPLTELDKLAKVSGGGSARHLAEEMAHLPEFRDKVDAPLWRDLVRLAHEISGMPRHVSQHVGGMVIASRPLVEVVPVEKARMPGRLVCQWDKDSVDDAGFVKIDFLALGMLSLVDECLDLIHERHGRRVDLSRIDFQDERVYDMICAGDTIGVFQIESRAQIQTLPRTRPRSLEDLTVEVAIIRPGPVVGRSVNPYIQRRQGRQPVTYDHPSLEPVLAETLGVIIYQEQVLQVAMAIAGFTAAQADQLRRAMSRKRSREAMQEIWQAFLDGARGRGVSDAVAETIFEKLLGFAEFGFPKSHSAAFALLAYQSAWLKLYYPAEFVCALLNAQPMGFYPPHVFLNDARRHGVGILRPDVNRGQARCTVEDGKVRLGLGRVAGLGGDTARAIVEERERAGPFTSLRDFVARTGLAREPIENLISVGAFSALERPPRGLLWELGLIYRPPSRQLPLPLPTEQDHVDLPEPTEWERMLADYGILNLSPDHHPMRQVRPFLPPGTATAAALARLRDGASVQIAGLVVCRQRPATAKGTVFHLLEDETGLANVVIHARLYDQRRPLVRREPFVLVRGRLQRRDDTINVIAHTIEPVRALPAFARATAHPTPAHRSPAATLTLIAPPAHNFAQGFR